MVYSVSKELFSGVQRIFQPRWVVLLFAEAVEITSNLGKKITGLTSKQESSCLMLSPFQVSKARAFVHVEGSVLFKK